MQPAQPSQTRLKLISVVVAIVVIAGVVLLADNLKATKTDTTSSTKPTTQATAETAANIQTETVPPTTAATSTASGYKDGTYTATSKYFVPHGNQVIKVTLSLKDGVVTDTSVENSEGDNVSADYQQAFTAQFKPQVVGKKISDLQINVIAGASDTVEGFNEALAKIALQAKA